MLFVLSSCSLNSKIARKANQGGKQYGRSD